MPGAARVSDSTTHGWVVVGPGVATVLVGSLPAAVAGDMHACVITPGHPPSTPFPVGSTTVFISGRPAIRANDVCGCGAGVLLGLPTVNIG